MMIRSSSSTKTSGATFAQLAVPMQVERSIRTVTEPIFRSTESVTAVRVIVSARSRTRRLVADLTIRSLAPRYSEIGGQG